LVQKYFIIVYGLKTTFFTINTITIKDFQNSEKTVQKNIDLYIG
jgi:hypothetical protein